MRLKTFVEMESLVVASRDEVRKEGAERKAGSERVERSEQQRIKAEGQMRQEVLDVKNNLKKETRDRELMATKIVTTVREEGQKREEAIEREVRLRQESSERSTEAMHSALRDERRARERE